MVVRSLAVAQVHPNAVCTVPSPAREKMLIVEDPAACTSAS